MEGQLSEHPLAELIREGMNARLSGALRLTRQRVKVAVYFAGGAIVYGASNLRAHRFLETLKHDPSAKNLDLDSLPNAHSDEQLAALLSERGLVPNETIRAVREHQVADALRLALLWTNGIWEFDPRIRVATDLHVQIDVDKLLLECARHLPASFVTSRLQADGTFSRTARDQNSAPLLPREAFVLSRVTGPISFQELTAIGGVTPAETSAAIYALVLAGLLNRDDWPRSALTVRTPRPAKQPEAPKKPAAAPEPADQTGQLNAFFTRLDEAQDYYQVLDIGRLADAEEVKRAYHFLARNFHPDRFHKGDPELRQRIESGFARVARAYETLSNASLRSAYDAKVKSKVPDSFLSKPAPTPIEQNGNVKSQPASPKTADAEASFQKGLAAIKQNQRDLGLRLLAEAAMLDPRGARYRAQYGYELIKEPGTRRIAENELKAAITLEPNNASYRVMLAELYKQLGLKRRAEGELERALVTDPKNEAARTLLSSLKRNRV